MAAGTGNFAKSREGGQPVGRGSQLVTKRGVCLGWPKFTGSASWPMDLEFVKTQGRQPVGRGCTAVID